MVGDRFCESVGFRRGFNVDNAASVVNLIVARHLQPADKEHTLVMVRLNQVILIAQAMFISGSACFLILTVLSASLDPTN